MGEIVILVIEDESEVRDALVRDLEYFEDAFRIEAAEDAVDAEDVVKEILETSNSLGLVLADHILPGKTGVDFLVELNNDPRTAPARKILVTGQAGLDDTIKAVNDADLDHFIAKPWTVELLKETVSRYLTDYVLDEVSDPLPYVSTLDSARILEGIKHRKDIY